MSEIYGVKRLRTIEDWVEVVTRRHYKPGHSAYECAHKWKEVKSRLPEPIAGILQKSPQSILRDLEICQIQAEYAVYLDVHTSPSKNDLLLFCECQRGQKVVIAVEAKCDESFAQPIRDWLCTADAPNPRSQRKIFTQERQPVERKLRRLAFLNEVLSQNFGRDSTIRYQLLHRFASAILTARQTFARAGVMLIEAFTQSDRNFKDFQDFCAVLGFPDAHKDSVIGPYFTRLMPDIPIFMIYVQDRRQVDLPHDSLFSNPPTNQAA